MDTITTLVFLLCAIIVLAKEDISRLPLGLQMEFKKLQHLVQSTEEPKGTPFSALISKPDPSQRIAIVGAGLSGLHMAYLLQKKGFNNIVIFERDSRVGGKVESIWHDGVPHEMGASKLTPDYLTNVYALANELGVDEFVPLQQSTVWLDNVPLPLVFKSYVVREVKQLTKAKDDLEAIGNLIDATYRYSLVHRQMFGKYEGELMHKPSSQVLSQLNQTFLSFLMEHDLLALVPVLIGSHTLQGYGHLDTVPSLYGMLWNTPNLLYTMLSSSIGVSKRAEYMFRNGFQTLIDKLATFSDVHLNVAIENIKRDSTGVTIKYNDGQDKTERFDFLIWSADARGALGVLEDTTPLEKEFSDITNTWVTTTLFNSKEQFLSYTPIDDWLSNLYYKREQSVLARRISKDVIKAGHFLAKRGHSTRISSVAYQMGNEYPAESPRFNEIFNQHFKRDVGAEDINVIKRKTCNHFPRFSLGKTADGILWDIAENQGNKRTWYIGSSVIFESTKSVVEYNNLMMSRMQM